MAAVPPAAAAVPPHSAQGRQLSLVPHWTFRPLRFRSWARSRPAPAHRRRPSSPSSRCPSSWRRISSCSCSRWWTCWTCSCRRTWRTSISRRGSSCRYRSRCRCRAFAPPRRKTSRSRTRRRWRSAKWLPIGTKTGGWLRRLSCDAPRASSGLGLIAVRTSTQAARICSCRSCCMHRMTAAYRPVAFCRRALAAAASLGSRRHRLAAEPACRRALVGFRLAPERHCWCRL